MRFLHLSDLHLGKRVCEFSMLDDQRYILEQILSLLDTHPVDAVLMANTGSFRSASAVRNQSSRRTASAGGTGLS